MAGELKLHASGATGTRDLTLCDPGPGADPLTVVQKAAEDYKPLHMATYAFELAKSFHTFYHNVRVLQADSDDKMNSRLRITAAARRTLANALSLLDIEAPQMM